MIGLKKLVGRVEKQVTDQAAKAYIASLPGAFLGEYHFLDFRLWLCRQPEPPRFREIDTSAWPAAYVLCPGDAEVAALHAEGFTSEHRARMEAMEREYVEGGLKRGLPRGGDWAQL